MLWGRLLGNARTQILLWLVSLISLAIAASALVTRQILLLQLYDRVDSSLAQEAEEINRLTAGRNPATGERFAGDVEAIFDVFLSRNVPEDDEFFLALIDGELYASSPLALPTSIRNNPTLFRRWGNTTTAYKGQINMGRESLSYLVHPLPSEGENQGVFAVVHSITNRQQDLEGIVWLTVKVTMAVFAVALTLAWIAMGRVLSPLRLLTETARSIQAADQTMQRRIPVRGATEVAELTQTFNDMLDRLQVSFTSQRDFINDASHELQTPITVIQGHLEILSKHPQDYPDIVPLIKDELQRMSRLVRDLLMLARSERPDFLSLSMVDVKEVTYDIYSNAMAIAPRQWSLAEAASVRIVADRDRIIQVMMNLIKNAIGHTSETDHIELGSRLVGEQVQFWVRDSGAGIAPADQHRIFQRFARAARSRRLSDGAGLGLAIVQAIVQTHGGTVSLDSSLGHGSTFTVLMPLEPPQDTSAP